MSKESALKFLHTLGTNEKAKELLARSPGITISEAAYRTGFSDNSHFTKVFRRITGLTPLQFVNDIKNDQNTDK